MFAQDKHFIQHVILNTKVLQEDEIIAALREGLVVSSFRKKDIGDVARLITMLMFTPCRCFSKARPSKKKSWMFPAERTGSLW